MIHLLSRGIKTSSLSSQAPISPHPTLSWDPRCPFPQFLVQLSPNPSSPHSQHLFLHKRPHPKLLPTGLFLGSGRQGLGLSILSLSPDSDLRQALLRLQTN